MLRYRISQIGLIVGLAGLVACGNGGADTTGTGGAGGATASASSAAGTTTAGTGGAGGAAPKTGKIEITVAYAGAQTGTLSVAAVTSFPPTGAPVAYQSNKTPTFPAQIELIGLDPGTYYLAAVLDIGNNNPQAPGAEDLVAVTMPPVTVLGNDAPMVSLTLMDKP
jgi:hypothetical protein